MMVKVHRSRKVFLWLLLVPLPPEPAVWRDCCPSIAKRYAEQAEQRTWPLALCNLLWEQVWAGLHWTPSQSLHSLPGHLAARSRYHCVSVLFVSSHLSPSSELDGTVAIPGLWRTSAPDSLQLKRDCWILISPQHKPNLFIPHKTQSVHHASLLDGSINERNLSINERNLKENITILLLHFFLWCPLPVLFPLRGNGGWGTMWPIPITCLSRQNRT